MPKQRHPTKNHPIQRIDFDETRRNRLGVVQFTTEQWPRMLGGHPSLQ